MIRGLISTKMVNKSQEPGQMENLLAQIDYLYEFFKNKFYKIKNHKLKMLKKILQKNQIFKTNSLFSLSIIIIP